jgi:hypothetical protein
MKKQIILLFVIAMTISNCHSQCDIPIKKYTDLNSNETTYTIKKHCGFGGRKESFFFNIIKKKDCYYFYGYIERGLSRKFEILHNSPLVFGFADSLHVILYPADSTKSYAINESGYLGSITGTVIYEVSAEQMKFLSDNVPTDIRLHYFSDQINPKYSDEFGAYWPLFFKLKMNYKIFIKAAKCALSI